MRSGSRKPLISLTVTTYVALLKNSPSHGMAAPARAGACLAQGSAAAATPSRRAMAQAAMRLI